MNPCVVNCIGTSPVAGSHDPAKHCNKCLPHQLAHICQQREPAHPYQHGLCSGQKGTTEDDSADADDL